jgi:diguanylate cyclase (GGDEF)-like protein/PAS domain S-box-containing protein
VGGKVFRRATGDLDPIPVLEATPECVLVVHADGRIGYANRRAAELLGRQAEELRGSPLDTVMTESPLGREGAGPFESKCRRSDGTEVPVEVRVGSLGSNHSKVLSVREVGVASAEAKLRAVVEQIAAVTYTWAWRGDRYFVVYSSPQIEQILGYTPEEWTADPTAWYDWVHPDDRALVIAENKRCEETGEAYSMHYRMVRKDGKIIWVEDSWVVVVDEQADYRVFQGVVFDITQRKIAEQEIAFLAHHDKLTGLPNRASFEENLEMAIFRARRHDFSVAVLFLDLDNFKLVNDSLGHQAGDGLLIELAERLRGCMRDSDVVARQGGDEFLILLSDIERDPAGGNGAVRSALDIVTARIHAALREPFDLKGTEFRASGSIGVSLFPQDGLDPETLLKKADSAMYQAKKSDPGGHVFFGAGGTEPLEQLALSTRLRQAVEEQNWVLHYQPIIDLATGAVTGVEALIRWREPNGGLIEPGEFIPLAEELGLIEGIGEWVVEEMATQQKAWADDGLDLEMSFNLSPRELWSAHLADRVREKLRVAGVDPRRIVVEVTESTAMAEPDRTQKILAELHAWGLRLAIDDFGTGYSSLSRLKHMPVDILKIDGVFVRDVDKDVGLSGMVRAMIQLAHGLNMIPLAEGVETHAEYVFLRANGCRLAQGFYFARPSPASEIPALAARQGGLVPTMGGLVP